MCLHGTQKPCYCKTCKIIWLDLRYFVYFKRFNLLVFLVEVLLARGQGAVLPTSACFWMWKLNFTFHLDWTIYISYKNASLHFLLTAIKSFLANWFIFQPTCYLYIISNLYCCKELRCKKKEAIHFFSRCDLANNKCCEDVTLGSRQIVMCLYERCTATQINLQMYFLTNTLIPVSQSHKLYFQNAGFAKQ